MLSFVFWGTAIVLFFVLCVQILYAAINKWRIRKKGCFWGWVYKNEAYFLSIIALTISFLCATMIMFRQEDSMLARDKLENEVRRMVNITYNRAEQLQSTVNTLSKYMNYFSHELDREKAKTRYLE